MPRPPVWTEGKAWTEWLLKNPPVKEKAVALDKYEKARATYKDLRKLHAKVAQLTTRIEEEHLVPEQVQPDEWENLVYDTESEQNRDVVEQTGSYGLKTY